MKPTSFRLLAATAIILAAVPASAQDMGPFDPARLSEIDRAISTDAFEGRGPATRAEAKTVDFITRHFQEAGIQPAGDMVNGVRQWTQKVPLLKSAWVAAPALSVALDGKPVALTQGEEIVVRSPMNGTSRLDLDSAPLVFAGYGVKAPERGWDDFKGQDMRGKILVVLVNDPDFEGGEGDFGGKAMTYYGRWTYKYEEGARQGAAGVLVIHETAPASYGWATVKNSNTNEMFDIVRDNPAAAHPGVEGWIQKDLAQRIFAASGLDFDAMKAAARKKDFKPVALNATLSLDGTAKAEVITSHNVVGYLPGAKYPDETVIYTAHWDHLGIGKPDETGDAIYNGAFDNGTGIAQLIEQARVFAKEPRTDRSIVFLAVGAEEKGLLGSEYYAQNPLFAPGKTAGVINTDGGAIYGPSKNFTISGNAKLGLLDMLIAEGKEQGRYYSPDPHPEAGYFFRSDHFSFAKIGVPAISFGEGNDLVNGGIERGEALVREYVEKHYHQPSDEWSADWDFSGMAEDANLLHKLGRNLANSRAWPNWGAESEFRAARDRTAAERGESAAPAPAPQPPKGDRG
ncbi:MAG TPA: M28 family metallopeptidase [Sphingomicrobium sp.]|nr:M28 family metallopeptidase [Sphingomicrobium sp.]